MTWLVAFLLLLVVALHAYRMTRVNDQPTVGDAFTYLRVAREVRAQRALFPELRFYYTTGEPERLQLPPLLMWQIALLPRVGYRGLMQLPMLTDLVTAAVVAVGGVAVLGLRPGAATLGALVLLLTPINAVTAASLTPRPLGLLWLTLFGLAMVRYGLGGSVAWVVAAAVCAALALLAQRMVTQVLFILAPIVGAVLALAGYPVYLHLVTATLGGLALAWLVTGGQYGRVIADHWRRVRVHMRFGQQERQRLEFGDPGQIAKACPWLFLAAAAWIAAPPALPPFALAAGLATGCVVLAFLWVMGNSVNHMYFASPFVAWLVAGALPRQVPWLVAAGLVAAACAVFIWREFNVVRRRRLARGWENIFRWVRERGLAGRALVLPQVGFSPLVFYTPLVLVAAGHGSKALTFDRMAIRGRVAEPGFLAQFMRDNGVRYVFLDRSLAAGGLADVFAAGAPFRELFAAGDIAVFEAADAVPGLSS